MQVTFWLRAPTHSRTLMLDSLMHPHPDALRKVDNDLPDLPWRSTPESPSPWCQQFAILAQLDPLLTPTLPLTLNSDRRPRPKLDSVQHTGIEWGYKSAYLVDVRFHSIGLWRHQCWKTLLTNKDHFWLMKILFLEKALCIEFSREFF